MSRIRTNSSLEDVDRIAEEAGVALEAFADCRTFAAFGRDYAIKQAPAGKVGLFRVEVKKFGEGALDAEMTIPHGALRTLLRKAAEEGASQDGS